MENRLSESKKLAQQTTTLDTEFQSPRMDNENRLAIGRKLGLKRRIQEEKLPNTADHLGKRKRVESKEVKEDHPVGDSEEERQSDGSAGRKNPAEEAVRLIIHSCPTI
jgi:hypothetical protein